MSEILPCLIELATPASTNLTQDAWATIAGTFTRDSKTASEFTLATSGAKVTYGGANAATVFAWASASVDPASTAKEIALQFAVNGVQVQQQSSIVAGATGNSTVVLSTILAVVAGQTVELKMTNHTDSTDATVNRLSMMLLALG
jgi:hypothetical protein